MAEKITATFVVPAKVYYRASCRLHRDLGSRVPIFIAVAVVILLMYLAADRLPPILVPIARQIAGDNYFWSLVLAIAPLLVVLAVLFLGARYALALVAQRRISERLKPESNPTTFTAGEDGLGWSTPGKGSLALAWAGIERILMIDGYLIFGAGFVGMIVPIAALGADWKAWLRNVMERLTPEARAASEKELRNVL